MCTEEDTNQHVNQNICRESWEKQTIEFKIPMQIQNIEYFLHSHATSIIQKIIILLSTVILTGFAGPIRSLKDPK